MTTLKVENLSYNSNLEREAMDAVVAGSGFFRSFLGKAFKWARNNPDTVIRYGRKAFRLIRRIFF